MFDRAHLERVLKVNGLSLDAEEEEIRSVLTSARYRDGEVDMAIAVLQGKEVKKNEAIETTKKILHTDKTLNPQEISKLLGIDVRVTHHNGVTSGKSMVTPGGMKPLLLQLIVFGIALLVAIVGLLGAMYYLQFGFFHPTAALGFFHDV